MLRAKSFPIFALAATGAVFVPAPEPTLAQEGATVDVSGIAGDGSGGIDLTLPDDLPQAETAAVVAPTDIPGGIAASVTDVTESADRSSPSSIADAFSNVAEGLEEASPALANPGTISLDIETPPTEVSLPIEPGVIALNALSEDFALDVASALPVDVVDEPAPPVGTLSGLWPTTPHAGLDTPYSLDGERATAELGVFVPTGANPTSITISALSSAYVLPERSVLEVSVGGTSLGDVDLRDIVEFKETELPVPPGLLKPGYNPVVLDSRHIHRNACGFEASYDLWTAIDLGASGVRYDPERTLDTPETFLAELSSHIAQGGHTGIKTSSQPDLQLAQAEIQVAHALGQAMGGAGVTFAPEDADTAAEDGPRINLRHAISEAQARARRDTDTGSMVLDVAVGPDGLPDLEEVFANAASTTPLPNLPMDVFVPFSSLGMPVWQVEQSLWTGQLEFMLPEDWLVKTKLRAEMRLNYGYAADLPPRSQLRIVVNGKTIRILPLDRPEGLFEDDLPIRFDAMYLTSGRNRIDFEVTLPRDASNSACPGTSGAMVEIGNASSIKVPSVPKMQAPDLARALEQLDQTRLRNARMPDFTIEPDGRVLQLASLLPNEAASDDPDSIRLTVLRLRELTSAHFGSFQIGMRDIQGALTKASVAPDDDIVTTDEADTAEAENGDVAIGSLLTARVVAPDENGNTITGRVLSTMQGWADGLTRMISPNGPSELEHWLEGRQGVAALFTLDPKTPDEVYLVVPDSTDFGVAAAAVGRAVSEDLPLRGQFALLDDNGRWQVWADRTRLPELKQEIGWNSFRQILGNYAAARPLMFVAAILGTALISALIAMIFLMRRRHHL
ncbi:MAG: cellulose biosynthesis cyclic di-GMP-binding regulatory protein BcsB [Pseudomonadota bacterium]